MDLLIESFQSYYGLDWLALLFGFTGTYLLTQKYKIGFLLSALGCLSGLAVASISLQFGFILSNFLMMSMMCKGYLDWAKEAA